MYQDALYACYGVPHVWLAVRSICVETDAATVRTSQANPFSGASSVARQLAGGGGEAFGHR